MKIYDEITGEELISPDLTAGYLYDGTKVVGRTEEHWEPLGDTDGLQQLVPAEDIVEPCQYYHAYPEAELAARQPEQPSGDTEARLAALEDELAAAKILLGVE